MHIVMQVGVLVLAVAATFALLTAIAVISTLTYHRLPPDRRDGLPRSSYNFYGRRWFLFAKVTGAALIAGGALVVIGLL